ncbi:Low-affinity gluconate transporter [Candidatus Erwinia haradaeae]|uniref:Low-affinity gluconate transporter n=1 Tax=Candidatus Erwinia haradaeae TaxID=1922217 RepID=A0A451DIU5_9GAMM|nr:gluconate transporter [Candidatus Erwinia haradaeae]VFP86586.1 Low-affinity gluconate transporter [Candidatus Erwinia haradaeae]
MDIITLILTAVGSVFLLLFLVMKERMHAFIALILVSICAGVMSGMPLESIAATMQKGMGGTLGFLAIIVGLGAMFGKILQEVGVVNQIAFFMLKTFSERHASYALGVAGLICALPLFFEVAVVLLISIAFAVGHRTGENLVKLLLSLFSGMAAASAFLLPGPAPMLLALQMHADFGWMILLGLCSAIPGMLIAGPIFGGFISQYVQFPKINEDVSTQFQASYLPSFPVSLSLILCPLLLVCLKTIGECFTSPDTSMYRFLELIGHPFIAILISCLLVIYGIARPYGMDKEKVMQICASSLHPAGIILLVIGAGGVFKQVLVDSGIGSTLGSLLIGSDLPIAIACFLLAGAVRIIQGSATIACLTVVGLVTPIIEPMHYSGAQLAALSMCISGGSIILSHVNDAGFWLFSRFTAATESQTLKTWTVMETILGSVGGVIGIVAFKLLAYC